MYAIKDKNNNLLCIFSYYDDKESVYAFITQPNESLLFTVYSEETFQQMTKAYEIIKERRNEEYNYSTVVSIYNKLFEYGSINLPEVESFDFFNTCRLVKISFS